MRYSESATQVFATLMAGQADLRMCGANPCQNLGRQLEALA
jgi:hypothetical protein